VTDPGETRLIRDILDFWFLPLDDPEHGKPRKIWWDSTPEFDAENRTRFGALVDKAIAGGLDSWRKSPDGALALVLLCDQFPRNIHRKSVKAYSGDPIALPGLWGLAFGNGNVRAGPTDTLYYAYGGADEQHGVFGAITAN